MLIIHYDNEADGNEEITKKITVNIPEAIGLAWPELLEEIVTLIPTLGYQIDPSVIRGISKDIHIRFEENRKG